jgi:hypothetical protein
MNTRTWKRTIAGVVIAAAASLSSTPASLGATDESNEVLDWNQLFIDSLVLATPPPPNAASPRLGAIVHTAMFDAYNGIERRYTPVFVHTPAPRGASRRAAVIAAAHTALVALFPSRKMALDDNYAASLAALSDDGGDGGHSRERGIAWGVEVAQAVLAWRANDGFSSSPPAFTGGTAVGQWRPTPPAFGAMSLQSMAYTDPFVLIDSTQFQPEPPRGLGTAVYAEDFNAVQALGRKTGSTRSADQTALAPFWEGSASVHWNQAANQIARARGLSLSRSNRLFAVLNIAMADTAFTIWSAKRFYGANSSEVTWRPVTALPLGAADGNGGTTAEPTWEPLMTTPSHPEYPAGHPSFNGAGATVLRSYFGDGQTFTLTTVGQLPRTYGSIAQARSDGNNARIWGGMHYPSTVQISDGVGEAIATYVNRNAMVRRHGRPR